MKLSLDDQAVLGIFGEHKLTAHQYLPLGLLDKERRNLSVKVRKNWDNIIARLRVSGYLVLDPLGYGLTHKAYDHIRRSSEQSGKPKSGK